MRIIYYIVSYDICLMARSLLLHCVYVDCFICCVIVRRLQSNNVLFVLHVFHRCAYYRLFDCRFDMLSSVLCLCCYVCVVLHFALCVYVSSFMCVCAILNDCFMCNYSLQCLCIRYFTLHCFVYCVFRCCVVLFVILFMREII